MALWRKNNVNILCMSSGRGFPSVVCFVENIRNVSEPAGEQVRHGRRRGPDREGAAGPDQGQGAGEEEGHGGWRM